MKALLAAALVGSSFGIGAAELAPVVEIEEDVDAYTNPISYAKVRLY